MPEGVETAIEPPVAEPARRARTGTRVTRGRPVLDAAAMRRLWPQIMERIRALSRTTWAMLDGAQVIEADGQQVTVAVAPSLAKRIAEDRNTTLISSALTDEVGGVWRSGRRRGGGVRTAGQRCAADRSDGGRHAMAPEPDPRDDSDDEPPPTESASVVDSEAEVLKLLHDQLGARPVDRGLRSQPPSGCNGRRTA